MTKDNGGGNSPPVREVGDAPHITRLLGENIERKTFLSSHSSPEKFARYLQEFTSEDCWRGEDNVYKSCREDFTGVKHIREAFDMAIYGWKDGGETIEKARSFINALNPIRPQLVRYGIAGTTPNVPRAIAGNILNMRLPDKKPSKKNKTITIVYNMCEAWMANKDNICNKAAVTAALVDEIEAKGFSVEVIATAATGNTRMRAVTRCCVKESHHPVDINRLAFSLGHSAMFRGMMFASWESDHFCSDLGYGLGIVSTTQPTVELCEKQIYTITSGHYDNPLKIDMFDTVDLAAGPGLQAMIKQLRKQGCPAFTKWTEQDDALEKDEVVEKPPHWDDDW